MPAPMARLNWSNGSSLSVLVTNLTLSSVMAADARPRALVTAPFRGDGLRVLEQVADVVHDPWIEHSPLRLYDEAALAGRLAELGAEIVVCEADRCAGPVLDLPLRVIGSAR